MLRVLVVGMVAVLGFGVFKTSVVHAETLTLAVGEWPPYFSANLRESGVFAHIVKEAFARRDYEVRFEFYPWARALSLAQEGKVAASPGWVRTDERARTFLFSDPVILSREVIFYRTEPGQRLNSLEDLAGLRVGATVGYSYGPTFEAAEQKKLFPVERTPTDEQNLRKLLAKRVDAVALNQVVGWELLSRFTPEERAQIQSTPWSLVEKESRMAIGLKHPDAARLLRDFNEGLVELSREGLVARYLEAAENGAYRLGTP